MSKVNKSSSTKKEYKFNFVDLILIILCLAIIGGCVYLFSPNTSFDLFKKKESVELQYTIEILGVDEEFIDKINESDNVIDSISKSSLGTVVAVDYNTKHTTLSYTKNEEDATGILVEHPDQYNLIVTISVQADYEAGSGYYVNNCRLAVGELLSLRFPNFVCECYCIAISV